jgi:hypothetical protein
VVGVARMPSRCSRNPAASTSSTTRALACRPCTPQDIAAGCLFLASVDEVLSYPLFPSLDDLVDAIQVVEAEAPARAEELKALVDPEVLAQAEDLARYEEDEAGGLMTPEFISLRASMTVEQVLSFLRRAEPEAETIYYLYVVDHGRRLLGVAWVYDQPHAEAAGIAGLIAFYNERVDLEVDDESWERPQTKFS